MKKIIITAITCLALLANSALFVSCKKDKKNEDVPQPKNDSLQNKDTVVVKPGQFKDTRDGQVYDSIRIGTQTWMKQNLNYAKDSSKCAPITDGCKKYGKFYTYIQATEACPHGWHLPSDDEWKTLEKQFGMSQTEVDLFSTSQSDRGNKRDSLVNAEGFNALYAGRYFISPNYYVYEEYEAAFWANNQIIRRINTGSGTSIMRYDYTGEDNIMFSVRCIKN